VRTGRLGKGVEGTWVLADTEEEWFEFEREREKERACIGGEVEEGTLGRMKERVKIWQRDIPAPGPADIPSSLPQPNMPIPSLPLPNVPLPAPVPAPQNNSRKTKPKPKPKVKVKPTPKDAEKDSTGEKDPSPLGFPVIKRASASSLKPHPLPLPPPPPPAIPVPPPVPPPARAPPGEDMGDIEMGSPGSSPVRLRPEQDQNQENEMQKEGEGEGEGEVEVIPKIGDVSEMVSPHSIPFTCCFVSLFLAYPPTLPFARISILSLLSSLSSQPLYSHPTNKIPLPAYSQVPITLYSHIYHFYITAISN
jgi:hypothetical protein